MWPLTNHYLHFHKTNNLRKCYHFVKTFFQVDFHIILDMSTALKYCSLFKLPFLLRISLFQIDRASDENNISKINHELVCFTSN